MTGVSHRVLRDQQMVLAIEAEAFDETNLFRWSGVLEASTSLVIESFSSSRRTRVCVAARSQAASVVIDYGDTQDEFIVEPGSPLVFLAAEAPTSVSVYAMGSDASLEVMVCASQHLFGAASAFLVLNASTGIRFGVGADAAKVYGWRDTRPETGAPEEFERLAYLHSGSRLIASDPDFNGHPSVAWEYHGTDEAYGGAGYAYPSVEGLFDFMAPGGEFLMMAILKAPQDGGGTDYLLQQGSGANGPFVSIEPGYRFRFEHFVSSVSVLDETDEAEVIEDGTASVLIIRQSTSAGIDVYHQGRWWHVSDALAPASPSSPIRPMVGYIPSSAMATFYPDGVRRGLKLADLRVWNSIPSNEQDIMDAYRLMAEDYGVDDSARQGHPFISSSFAAFRANRGIVGAADSVITDKSSGSPTTFVGIAVSGWLDTRPEGPLSSFAFEGDIGDPTTLPSLEGLGAEMAIHAYGGGAADGTASHRLVANTAAVPPFAGEFTAAVVIEPELAFSSWLGGGVMATGGSGADDAIFLSLTAGGDLRLFISETGETDIDITLPIGVQVFGHKLGITMRVGAGSIELKAQDLTAHIQYSTVVSVPWDGFAPAAALALFDFVGDYYAASQWFEGKMYEVCFVPEKVSPADREKWFTYAQRRYG